MGLQKKKDANSNLGRGVRLAVFVSVLTLALAGGTDSARAIPVSAANPAPVASASVPAAPGTPVPAANGVGVATSGSPSSPLSNLQYGFTMALLQNNTTVRNMGFTWVEYTLGWDTAEPSPGAYDWGNADNIVNYARNAGINVVIRVSLTPTWARNPSCASVNTCPPADPNTFGAFMQALAGHVRVMIQPSHIAYELWNEPNVDNEWGGMCPDPEFYTRMVQAAYPRIKAVDASATVIAGAVTTVGVGHTSTPACFVDDLEFIQRMYTAGARGYFDVLSDHPYGYNNEPEADPMTTQPPLVFRRAERHHDIMVANGDGNKQIWATEMGWAMDPRTLGEPCNPPDWYYIYTPQQQADYLVRAFQWARSYWPWMGAMFVFNFDFSQAPWYQECDAFRFWSVIGRPAQSALSNFAHNPPPTYTPVVDNPPVINAIRYSQVNFNRNGGSLVVDVDASDTDSSPVSSVSAVLTYPDNSTQLYDFALVSGNNNSGTWEATMSIPGNNTGGTQIYTVSPYVVEANPPGRTTNGPVQQIQVTNTRFSDVPNDYWAYTYIEYLASHGIISGYSDNTFRPGNSATRGQFSKMLVLGLGWPIDTTGGPHFTDVPPGSAFYDYVETAYNRGVISGYVDRTFRPNNYITRSQIAKMIVNGEGWPIDTTGGPHFTDVLTTDPFYTYVETAYNRGIISGYSDGTFRPRNNATRAQISKMLYIALTSATPTVTATATGTPTSTVTPGAKAPPPGSTPTAPTK